MYTSGRKQHIGSTNRRFLVKDWKENTIDTWGKHRVVRVMWHHRHRPTTSTNRVYRNSPAAAAARGFPMTPVTRVPAIIVVPLIESRLRGLAPLDSKQLLNADERVIQTWSQERRLESLAHIRKADADDATLDGYIFSRQGLSRLCIRALLSLLYAVIEDSLWIRRVHGLVGLPSSNCGGKKLLNELAVCSITLLFDSFFSADRIHSTKRWIE